MRLRLPFARRLPPAPFPTPAPVPLHTPDHAPAPGAVPLDAALRIARDALARHGDADIHSRTAMYFAAVDLDHALRLVVSALDYRQEH
ncbi:hypothetical protein [Streptomyces sp. CC208A]|uniref:hypothetical protein n=1 Tax=Streptomyces sp. CC208A TaxID=3044573 RepID=UPI0024A93A0B|nr:hypothetical protein [Streptomyces sp. CC208A]